MGKNKRIAIRKNIYFSDNKQPKINKNPDSYFDKTPSWCFSKSDFEHPKWSPNKSNFISDILPKLCSFEQKKWSEIVNDKKHNHWISVADFSYEAQKRASELPQLGDQLFSLHLTGTLRLFGFIEDGVYYLIWVDSKHEVCPSHKKHT